jgi:hypothetical protein
MDWSKKLLVFVGLPMFAIAGISYFVDLEKEEGKGYSDKAAAKPHEDPDYYEPDYYDENPKNIEPDFMEWEDAGSEAPYAYDYGDGDGDIDEDHGVVPTHYEDGDPQFDEDPEFDEDMMWPGATEMYVEEEPPPSKGLPWMTIMTAGIGSLTGLITAISALLRTVANFRRKEEDDEDQEEDDSEDDE